MKGKTKPLRIYSVVSSRRRRSRQAGFAIGYGCEEARRRAESDCARVGAEAESRDVADSGHIKSEASGRKRRGGRHQPVGCRVRRAGQGRESASRVV